MVPGQTKKWSRGRGGGGERRGKKERGRDDREAGDNNEANHPTTVPITSLSTTTPIIDLGRTPHRDGRGCAATNQKEPLGGEQGALSYKVASIVMVELWGITGELMPKNAELEWNYGELWELC